MLVVGVRPTPRDRSCGTLARLAESTLLFVLTFLGESLRDLACLATTSWAFNTIQTDESLWRALALHMIAYPDKVSQFTFHGSWKATVLYPYRLAGFAWHQQRAGSCDAYADSVRPRWARRPTAKGPAKWYNVTGDNLSAWPMHIGHVDRRHQLTLEAFVEEYERPNKPVLITGMIDHWPALQEWTADRFASHFPDLPLRTNGRSTNGRRYRMKAFDYFAYASSCNAEKFIYVFDKKLFFRQPEMVSYFDVPPYFREDLFSYMSHDDRPDYRWLLIGPNGSGSPFHTDPHRSSAWNAVIEGCKRVSFYPPEVIPPGVDEELIHSDYYASEDTMEWYRDTYPSLPLERLPLEVLVHPGEILFIPSGWWHSVLNIGLTVAVTQNYCSRRTFPFVASDMNEHASLTLRKDFKCALVDSPFPELARAIRTSE